MHTQSFVVGIQREEPLNLLSYFVLLAVVQNMKMMWVIPGFRRSHEGGWWTHANYRQVCYLPSSLVWISHLTLIINHARNRAVVVTS